MRKSSLILLLAMAFVLTTAAAGFSRGSVVDGPCKEPCKTWGYNLFIDDNYKASTPYQGTANYDPCPQFDYESAKGYCGANGGGDNYYNAAGVVFKVCDCPDVTFDVTKSYGIKIEIVEPATGVYFTNGNDSGAAYNCNMEGCATAPTQNIYVSSLGDTTDETKFCPNPCDGTPFVMGYVPLSASEVLFNPSIHDKTDGSECCLDCIGNLAKSIKTNCLQSFMFGASPYIMIDVPTMVWDPKIISKGTNVVIKVTIIGEAGNSVCPTCNDLCSCTIKVGEFGCPSAVKPTECHTCFPYFTSLDDAAWWSGFALTNSGNLEANVAMTFTAGGTSVAVSLTVPANTVLVKALSELDLSALSGKGPIYAMAVSTNVSGEITTAASINGFAIMGDNAQAYGYLAKDGMKCGCSSCK